MAVAAVRLTRLLGGVLLAGTVTVGCSNADGDGATSRSTPSPSVNASCVPPSEEAAVTGHWPMPPECKDAPKGND